jgi:hypothetical protein
VLRTSSPLIGALGITKRHRTSTSQRDLKTMYSDHDIERYKSLAKASAADPAQMTARRDLAKFTAEIFAMVGTELHAVGHILGTDRKSGVSPFGHGSDEIVAVSLLLRIAAQIVSASNDLFADGRHYAAAALLRQLVEIEYLAWAFGARDKDAERWLRSSADDRRAFFAPAKLRQAAGAKFRGKDYSYHCELGGHPVPRSELLLGGDEVTCQLLLSDLLGHTGCIWDNLLDWSAGQQWATAIQKRKKVMFLSYAGWKSIDQMLNLPPPP